MGRGHLTVNGFANHSARRTIDMLPNNAMNDLEKMIAFDDHMLRSGQDEDDHAMNAMKRRKAGSMNHLELHGLSLNHSTSDDKDQIVENEVEQIMEQKKKKKLKKDGKD